MELSMPTTRNKLIGSRQILALVAFATASLGARSANAVTLSYCDFSDTTGLVLNGTAAQNGALLALTDGGTDEAGTAFYGVTVPWTATTSFHTDFQFQIGETVAEGLSFIIQNDGSSALGGDSYQIGYGGITPSVEVEFDTYMDSWDPNANHVGVMTDGAYKVHLETGTPTFTMAGGGVLYAWIDYDATTTELDVYLSTTATEPAIPVVSATVNVSSVVGTGAFVGFTSATGAKTTSEQDVLEWEFSTDGIPCVCGGSAECSGSTPVCATTGPIAGLCVAATVADAGPPDASSDGASEPDGEVPDGKAPKDGGHDGAKPPEDAGKKDGGFALDSGTLDGGHSHAGPDASSSSSSGGRLSGGACSHAQASSASDEGPCLLAVVCGLAVVRSRRKRRSAR
jgi:hypothetical protein